MKRRTKKTKRNETLLTETTLFRSHCPSPSLIVDYLLRRSPCRGRTDIGQKLNVGRMARNGAAIELQRQMATESIVPRTDAEVAPTPLKRIAECKGARSRNVHQPIPGATPQAPRLAALTLHLGLVAPRPHAPLCAFVQHDPGANKSTHRRPDH